MNFWGKKFKIYLFGGIGDCLRTLLYLAPFQSLFEQGGELYVTYGENPLWQDCGHKEQIKNFVGHTNINWVEPQDFGSLDAVQFDPFNNKGEFSGLDSYRPIEIYLEQQELDILNKLPRDFLLLQLSSNAPEKIWSRVNFIKLIDLILKETDLNIVLIDWPFSDFKYEHERVFSLIGQNLAVAWRALALAKVYVGVESWTKYVGRALEKQMVLMYVDVTTGNDQDFLDFCLQEKSKNGKVKSLGLNLDGKLVKHVNEISPEKVAEEIRQLI